MKKSILISLPVLLLSCLYGQGSLTPPAAPAPTMKTLTQIEPRTPIESVPYFITAPGSYYFTKNLNLTATSGDAITITSNNVTLDLNGFTLSSSSAVTGAAIICDMGQSNVVIKNGNIVGNTSVTSGGSPVVFSITYGGFDIGVDAGSANPRNLQISNLNVSGCRNAGISATHSIVVNSTSSSNGTLGIAASYGSVMGSTAMHNGGVGIFAPAGSITGATVMRNHGHGISAQEGSITNSTAISNGGTGIQAQEGSVTSCVAKNNNTLAVAGQFDLNATNAVVAFTRYITGSTTGATLTGNKTP